MAILSYFTRFIMKRENAGSWDSGWKRSKYYRPILHSSKSPETSRMMFSKYIKNIESKNFTRGHTLPMRVGGAPYPPGRAPYLVGPLVALR